MIAALLKWTGLSQWMLDLIALAIVGAAVGVTIHHIYAKGEAAELAKITAAAQRDQQKLQAKIAEAEHSHDSEILDLQHYRDTHPDTLRVCIGPGVRTTPAAPRSAGAPTGGVQPVPAGDSGSGEGRAGPDIFGMLDALAGRADSVSAQLRARQRIEP